MNPSKQSRARLDVNEALLESNLLLEETKELQALFPASLQQEGPTVRTKKVRPEPGFCVKVRNDKNEKVFINICHSTELPTPDDITEEGLAKILESEEPSVYRVPMSLGNPHQEIDKSGNSCTAFDVMISKDFYDKVQQSFFFKTFLLTAVMEGLEDKHGIVLYKTAWTVLKNRRSFGVIKEHDIQDRGKPLVQEMSSNLGLFPSEEKHDAKMLITEVKSDTVTKQKTTMPEFEIKKDPPGDFPSNLIAEFKLPRVVTGKELALDLGEDRIVLEGRNSKYFLDLFIPYIINNEKSEAQFNRTTKVLKLTMPLKKLVPTVA